MKKYFIIHSPAYKHYQPEEKYDICFKTKLVSLPGIIVKESFKTETQAKKRLKELEKE